MSDAPPTVQPPERRSLRHDVVMMVGGRFAYLAAQGGALIALARLGSPEVVGIYSLSLAVAAPIQQFFSLNLRGILTTDATGEYAYATYQRLRNLTALAALVVSALIAVAVGYTGETLTVLLVLTVAKVAEAQSDLIFGLMQRKNQFAWQARSMVLKGITMFLGVCGGLLVGGGVVGAAWGTLLAYLLVYLAHDRPLEARIAPRGEPPDWQHAREIVTRALPMGAMIMLVALQANAPRYVLERLHGPALLGYFSATAYVVVFTNHLVTTLANAVLPRLADELHLGPAGGFDRLLRKTQWAAALAGLATTLVCALFGDRLLGLLFGADYAPYRWLLVGQTLVATLRGQAAIVTNGLVATRQFGALLAPGVLAMAAAVAGCVAFIPGYDVHGAVVAALLGAFTLFVVGSALLRRVLRDDDVGPSAPLELP